MERLRGKAVGSTLQKLLDRANASAKKRKKIYFGKALKNGFLPRNLQRGNLFLPGEKKNPSAEEFRHVIAERDGEAVETRGKNFIAGFVFRESMGLEKSAEKN